VSFAHPSQLDIAVDVCQSFAVDNGAFSAWRSGKPVSDWLPYYKWAHDCSKVPSCDFAVIPDVIDGNESDNDKLLKNCPLSKNFGAPVWHMHESTARLLWLARNYLRVCIGSSGEFSTIGDEKWWNRMAEAMNVVCPDGYPICKLHGLRMLDPEIFSRLPFASADSTNIGQNIGIDNAWRGTYQPPDKEWRACVMAARIESHNASSTWNRQFTQESLC
jgi:hypothetical protein